jgi:hypothetical protein
MDSMSVTEMREKKGKRTVDTDKADCESKKPAMSGNRRGAFGGDRRLILQTVTGDRYGGRDERRRNGNLAREAIIGD